MEWLINMLCIKVAIFINISVENHASQTRLHGAAAPLDIIMSQKKHGQKRMEKKCINRFDKKDVCSSKAVDEVNVK